MSKINKDEIKNSDIGFDVIQVKYNSKYYMTANDNYSYSLWNEHFKYEIIKRNISQREAMVFAKSLNKLTGKL